MFGFPQLCAEFPDGNIRSHQELLGGGSSETPRGWRSRRTSSFTVTTYQETSSELFLNVSSFFTLSLHLSSQNCNRLGEACLKWRELSASSSPSDRGMSNFNWDVCLLSLVGAYSFLVSTLSLKSSSIFVPIFPQITVALSFKMLNLSLRESTNVHRMIKIIINVFKCLKAFYYIITLSRQRLRVNSDFSFSQQSS